MVPLSNEICTLANLVDALDHKDSNNKHNWLCGINKNGQRSIQVLSHDEYTPERAVFWNKTCEKLGLIQLVSYVEFLIEKETSDSNDVISFIKNKNKILNQLDEMRNHAIDKRKSIPGLMGILQRVWYWLFDPNIKISNLRKLSDENLINKTFLNKINIEILSVNVELSEKDLGTLTGFKNGNLLNANFKQWDEVIDLPDKLQELIKFAENNNLENRVNLLLATKNKLEEFIKNRNTAIGE